MVKLHNLPSRRNNSYRKGTSENFRAADANVNRISRSYPERSRVGAARRRRSVRIVFVFEYLKVHTFSWCTYAAIDGV